QNLESLEELALGGTAVGTGLNTHPEFASRVIEKSVTARISLFEKQAIGLKRWQVEMNSWYSWVY
ncbi:hypothetical protein KKG05_07240, partial [bacterium]|nr:hypothetical protein [bacterium]